MLHRCFSLIVFVSCISFLTQAQSDVYKIVEKVPRFYCGTALSDMLAEVCEGKYNTKFPKKSSYAIESDSDEDYGYMQQQQQQQQPYFESRMMQFPYRTRANAASLISGTFRRYTRGIIDECCRKPCTRKEMRSYCAPEQKKASERSMTPGNTDY